MRSIVSTFALIAFGFYLVSCDKEEDGLVAQEPGQITEEGPQALTISAVYGAYYTVVLSGQISGLEKAALDYQCGFEYSTDRDFGEENTFRKSASGKYSKKPFSIIVTDIVPGQKYYYRAYYINQMFIYYGETKEFMTDEWKGPEAVDLGLSVKWADMNVDAYRPWERGNLYSWGEIEPKESYMWNTYKFHYQGTSQLTKYCNDKIYGYQEYTDAFTTLEPQDDVAHVRWGGQWRTPSKEEFLELMDTLNCAWIYTSMNGINGYKVSSKKNDNSIFLPETSDSHGCEGGFFWANSIEPECASSAPHLYFNHTRNHLFISTYSRNFGLTVRPVQP